MLHGYGRVLLLAFLVRFCFACCFFICCCHLAEIEVTTMAGCRARDTVGSGLGSGAAKERATFSLLRAMEVSTMLPSGCLTICVPASTVNMLPSDCL